MKSDDARALALAKLREIEDADHPLRLDDARAPEERDWCWVFPFDAVRYYETRRLLDSVASGPIVVNKDGSDAWVAGSSGELDEWLDSYAALRAAGAP